jgi:hypothetical protein
MVITNRKAIMDEVPAEIRIPERLPPLPFGLRWSKRFKRVSIEITYLFDRPSRQQKLAKFKEQWSVQERESAARGLAIRELWDRYGPARAFQIAAMRALPRNMNSRAGIYQQRFVYELLVEAYRTRMGLPPRDKPSKPAPP